MMKRFFAAIFLLAGARSYSQEAALFVVAGQSNAVGMGDSDLSVKPAPHTAFEYRYREDSLVELRDPAGAHECFFQPASTGSALPAFAKEYHGLTGKKVIIVPAARGGSSCHVKAELKGDGTWDTAGQMRLFDSAVVKIRAAIKKAGIPVSGIIWIQGERDANAINASQLTVAEYKAAFAGLINRFRSALGNQLKFYIVETGNYMDHPKQGFDAVREVQNALSRELPNVWVVYKGAKDFAPALMKDQIHYKQAAYNQIGTQVARWIVAHKTR